MSARKRATVPTLQVNFRLSRDIGQWLAAAAGVTGQPHSLIVTAALQQYRASLPATTRRLIDDALALRQKP